VSSAIWSGYWLFLAPLTVPFSCYFSKSPDKTALLENMEDFADDWLWQANWY
jgi:hypothetical protein